MDNDMEMYLEKILKKTNPEKYIEILEQDREDFAKEIVELNQRIDKAIEYLGINEEILKTCEIYDVNGIEVYKILQGEKNE